MYKIVFWTSLAILAILFVENMVSKFQAYVFFDTSSSTGMLVIASGFFGALAGYSFGQMFKKEDVGDDYDF